MQPFTPAFIEQGQPRTPVMAAPVKAPNVTGGTAGTEAQGDLDEIKTEQSWTLMAAGGVGEVIELSSESDTESSESASVGNSSADDDGIDLDQDDDPQESFLEKEVPQLDTVVARNEKTKIVHECRDRTPAVLSTQDNFLEAMKGTLTVCGRVITPTYKVVNGSFDWTAKCRVCFRGRRDPSVVDMASKKLKRG